MDSGIGKSTRGGLDRFVNLDCNYRSGFVVNKHGLRLHVQGCVTGRSPVLEYLWYGSILLNGPSYIYMLLTLVR